MQSRFEERFKYQVPRNISSFSIQFGSFFLKWKNDLLPYGRLQCNAVYLKLPRENSEPIHSVFFVFFSMCNHPFEEVCAISQMETQAHK